jgi:hypothetical protein
MRNDPCRAGAETMTDAEPFPPGSFSTGRNDLPMARRGEPGKAEAMLTQRVRKANYRPVSKVLRHSHGRPE